MLGVGVGGTRIAAIATAAKLHQLWRHSQGAISDNHLEAMIKVKEDEIAIDVLELAR